LRPRHLSTQRPRRAALWPARALPASDLRAGTDRRLWPTPIRERPVASSVAGETINRHQRGGPMRQPRIVPAALTARRLAEIKGPAQAKAPVASVDRPGDLGGSDPWRGWEPCQHSGNTPRSCASAR
jgi:hypothetical protein